MNIVVTKMNVVLFILSIFCLYKVSCDSDDCNFGTCGECISSPNCAWCAQEDIKDRRCRSKSTLPKNWCKTEDTYNLKPSTINDVVENKEFSSTKDAIVQLKPQRIKIKARPGVPVPFSMSYKPAKDYPLDVYCLMDMSFTMKKKMIELKNQALAIHTDLSKYTNNVRLGIGSFVEKPGFPFFDHNKHISHAFKNHVSLTDNMTQFTQTIDAIDQFGSNFDDPEAGLDGLMQSMKCAKEIGWRKQARRIIILSTDSTYHSAGDGKIVGAVKPHDMQCHLENNLYTMALTYDYPSVSQIAQVALEEKFIIIFAITKNKLTGYLPETEYKALAKQLNAKYASMEDGSGIIDIIHKAYNDAARTAPFTVKSPPYVQVTLDQECSLHNISQPTKNCETTHVQPVITIPGTLTIKSCPIDKKIEHIKISPSELDETLIIDLEVDCQCECEKKPGLPSLKCNNAGVLQCGICKCNPGSYGVTCSCNGTSTDQNDVKKCKLTPDSKPCNGNGQCICGKCTCTETFSGDFCEFSDTSCPWRNDKMCSGHGSCIRGQCQCQSPWTGNDCSCPDNDLDCYAPYSNEVCSGNGVCKCGSCICNKLEGKNETYLGAFCDICEDCAEKRCEQLGDYVYCNYENMNKTVCDERNNGTTKDIIVTFMNKTEINGPEMYMAKWCKKELENGTYIVFKYQYENLDLKLAIQKELESPPEVNIWIAVGSAVGLVLLIGILTVIVWKILIDLHDKREYKKFADEAAAAGYDITANPLYQAPAINFSNPVYDQNH